MKAHNLLNSIAAAVLVTGLALTGISSSAVGEQIGNNDRIDGVIRRTSPIYRFHNMWVPGSPTEELRGQEYTFSAREGDNIEVFLDTDRSRGFTPVMVLFYGNNKQVAFTQDRSFNYQIPRSGDYKLLVLAKDAARGGSSRWKFRELMGTTDELAIRGTIGTRGEITREMTVDMTEHSFCKMILACGLLIVARDVLW